MNQNMIFKRYELKFMISQDQKKKIIEAMLPYMRIDKYGHATIRNIYFDTCDSRLIRRSIEKPEYKEKLRMRAYGLPGQSGDVFVEIKKKYKHVVYKRRITLPLDIAEATICRGEDIPNDCQIAKEINYFLHFYSGLRPAVYLSYEREAFYSVDNSDFRVTFDENIRYRDTDISLKKGVWGNKVLDSDKVIMEVKTSGGIPLWMTSLLSEMKIYKTSFSKYGEAYKDMICGLQERGLKYA